MSEQLTHTRSLADTCKKWWAIRIAAETGAAKRTRAQLRRAGSVTEALGVSATHELYRELAATGHDLRMRRTGPDRLALIAVALAQVKQDHGASVAQRFGSGSPKALSSLRFNALIRAKDPRRLMRPLTRALRIVGGTANVRKLAADLYWWNDATRTKWCFDYHGASTAKPISEESTT